MATKALPPDRSLRVDLADKDDPSVIHSLNSWQSYTIIEDWLKGIPQFTLVPAPTVWMRGLIGPHSQRVKIFADNDAYQFDGYTDEREEDTSPKATTIDITGRGVAGQLVDCSIPVEYLGQKLLGLAGLTLLQTMQQTAKPWIDARVISGIITDAGPGRYIVAGMNRKISKTLARGLGHWDEKELKKDPPVLKWVDAKAKAGTGKGWKAVGKSSPYYKGIDREPIRSNKAEPGETPWALWKKLAAQVRAHVWSMGTGEVMLGMPCYQMDPEGAYGRGLYIKWNEKSGRAIDSNVMGSRVGTSGAERFSEYQMWGVAKPNKKSKGKELLPDGYTVFDPSPGYWKKSANPPYLLSSKIYRPKIEEIKGLKDPKLIRRIAMYMMEQAAINGISIEYELKGHTAPNGALWTIDSMVNIDDERNDIYGPHFIIQVQRRFQGVAKDPKGKTSLVKMIPPDVFLPTKLGDGSEFDPDTISDAAYLQHMAQRIWW